MNLFKLVFCESSRLSGECHFSDISISEPSTHLRIGVFFDGTGNDDLNEDTTTNIYKLFKLYPYTLGKKPLDRTPYCSIYATGVGTAGENKDLESVTGLGGDERWQGALYEIEQYVHIFKCIYSQIPKTIKLDVFGFSRGAASARHFVNIVLQRYFVESFLNRFDCIFEVEFLGLFDTVGSIGLPGNDCNPGYTLDVPVDKVNKTIHLVAEDELREKFDLVSVVPSPTFHAGHNYITDKVEEIICPGVHADIGGGYKSGLEHGIENNELALIYCNLMHNKAVRSGVPFDTPPPYRIQKELLSCYNAIESMYEHFDSSRSLKFRSLCRLNRNLSMTMAIAHRNMKKISDLRDELIKNPGQQETAPKNPLPSHSYEGNTSSTEEPDNNFFLSLDLGLHGMSNSDNYIDILEGYPKMINLTILSYLRIASITKKTGITSVEFLNHTKVFYDTYVHNSLLAKETGLPEIGSQGIIDKAGVKSEIIMFKRKVFTSKAIDLNDSNSWPRDCPYGFNRIAPRKSGTVRRPNCAPGEIIICPVPQ